MALPFFGPDQGMGIGTVGIGAPDTIFKRKFRWILEIDSSPNNPTTFSIPPYFVKVAARPNLSFEETEVNFLNDKTWIPGKATWEAITVTFLDAVNSTNNNTASLYTWLLSVFDFSKTNRKFMSSKRSCYTGVYNLSMLDGCGNAIDQWTLSDAWPQAINFGDLDYSSSDIAEIELTIRYSQVTYTAVCPSNQFTAPNCCGCSSF